MGRLLQPLDYPPITQNVAWSADVGGDIFSGNAVWQEAPAEYWLGIIQADNCFGGIEIHSNVCGYVYLTMTLQCDYGDGVSICTWNTEAAPCLCIPEGCSTLNGVYQIYYDNGGVGDCAEYVTVTLSDTREGAFALLDTVHRGVGGCRSCGLHA